MARGSRSRGGRFGRHRYGRGRFHSSHPSYSANLNAGDGAVFFEAVMDAVAMRTGQPLFFNGTLFMTGGEKTVINQLDNSNAIQPQFYQDPMAMMDSSMVPAVTPLYQNNNPLNTMTNQPFLHESLPGNMVPMEQMTIDPSFGNPNIGYPPSQPQMMMPPQPMMAPQPMVMPTSFPKVQIFAVGNKTSASSLGCYVLTYLLGSCLIFPLCFMCCMWWKKMVYPLYELNIEFYRCVGRYLRSHPACLQLTIKVCDNAFDSNKARLLYQSLSGTNVQTFTFTNQALACNYNGSGACDFVANMTPIKSLPLKSTITWGDMTL